VRPVEPVQPVFQVASCLQTRPPSRRHPPFDHTRGVPARPDCTHLKTEGYIPVIISRCPLFAAVIALWFLAAGCTPSQIATTNTIAADAQAVVADLTSAEQQVQAQGISAASLATIETAIAKVNSDISNLGTATASTSTVLTDIETAIAAIEPFAPEIAALIGTVAAPLPGTMEVQLVKPATLSSLQADLHVLKTDAGTTK
jgi:hypothetical protein